jgi:DDE superfamily endonuclease
MLSNMRFKRMFRLSRNAFWSLRELIRTSRNANGCGADSVPVESRLSMTLRYLAGGSYLDIAIAHHVSISKFYYVVDETLTDLDLSLNIKFPIDNLELLKRSSIGFSCGRSPLTGCAGALDGMAIKIFEPCAADAANPATYYNRKGFFALCIQEVCDFDDMFTFVSSQCPGSTHDSVAFAVSGLAGLLDCGTSGLPSGY